MNTSYLPLLVIDGPSLTRMLVVADTAYGLAYGLLNADMVERFLLHFFGMSAHTYTRGTWTVPEASHPDRDVSQAQKQSAVPAMCQGSWV